LSARSRTYAILGAILALTAVAGVLHYTGANDVAVFLVSAAALAGLAWVIAIATETVGSRFGPAVTGVLQSTLGNLPELFVVLFAISAGELVVAKTSIVGSLLANAFFVLGLSIMAGARAAPDGVMRFKPRLAIDTATLLLLAVFVIALLGVSDRVHFLGFVNRTSLPDAYAASDLLVLPSSTEAFGLVVNEAFAAQVLAVCRETGIEYPPIVNNLDLNSFRSSPHNNLNLMQGAVCVIPPCVFDHIADKFVEAYYKLCQYVLGEADFAAESL